MPAVGGQRRLADRRPARLARGGAGAREAHRVRAVAVGEQRDRRVGERIGVARRDDEPGAVGHQPGQLARPGRDDRAAVRLRLRAHAALARLHVGQRHDARAAEETRDVGLGDVVVADLDARVVEDSRVGQRAGARDDEPRLGDAAPDARHRVQEHVQALVARHATEEEQRRMVRRRRERGRVGAVLDDLDRRQRGAAGVAQLVAQALAVHEDEPGRGQERLAGHPHAQRRLHVARVRARVVHGHREAARPQPRRPQQPRIVHDAVLRVHDVGCEPAHRRRDASGDGHGVAIAHPPWQPPHRRIGAEPGSDLVTHRLPVAAEVLGVVAGDERDVDALRAQTLPHAGGVADEVIADEEDARRAREAGIVHADDPGEACEVAR